MPGDLHQAADVAREQRGRARVADVRGLAVAERLALLEEPPPFGENVAELRAKIRESIEQYELGRSVDGEEFMARLERESEEEMAGAVKAS